MDSLFSVHDQVVLVSGGSRGIGKGLATGFAQRGARVFITGRSRETLDAACAEIGHDVAGLVCDVTDIEQIRETVATIVAQSGRIDTLLNVAGVNRRQPAESFTPEDFDFVVDINLRGAFLVAVEAGKRMLEQGRGAQINIDSLNTYAPLANVAPYAMSKYGVVAMTRALATEWGPRGVRVNSIAPGFILTELTQKLWSDPTMQEWGRANTPMSKALGTPEDLVGAAVFLASEASQWMTGQVVRVDGGFSAGLIWPIPG
jgi:NAD(P)-dependent dehydrogenase (short-subunit alcohol dehydrogenase family)